jgi:hypothetical protein
MKEASLKVLYKTGCDGEKAVHVTQILVLKKGKNSRYIF